jgi:DnaJ-class molecular chaperone
MKTITRTYPKACEHCGGTGAVSSWMDSMSTVSMCPVCNGTGVVTVTETETVEDDLTTNNEILLT